MSTQVELDLGLAPPQTAPVPEGPSLLVVVGADRDACQRLTFAHWNELMLATCWVVPGDQLPRAHLKAAFATPRKTLPEDLRHQLDELEQLDALTTWSPP